jgi:hypothetical protein
MKSDGLTPMARRSLAPGSAPICEAISEHCSMFKSRTRSDDHPRSLAPPSWRPGVVLRLSRDALSRIGFMASSWCAAVRKQQGLAREGRLQLAIPDADGSGPSRQGENQAAPDRRARPRRVGPAAETKMDAMEDLSPACRAIRKIRSHARCRRAVTRQQARQAQLMAGTIINETNKRRWVNESDSINTGRCLVHRSSG